MKNVNWMITVHMNAILLLLYLLFSDEQNIVVKITLASAMYFGLAMHSIIEAIKENKKGE